MSEKEQDFYQLEKIQKEQENLRNDFKEGFSKIDFTLNKVVEVLTTFSGIKNTVTKTREQVKNNSKEIQSINESLSKSDCSRHDKELALLKQQLKKIETDIGANKKTNEEQNKTVKTFLIGMMTVIVGAIATGFITWIVTKGV